jgi:hypothetical protein
MWSASLSIALTPWLRVMSLASPLVMVGVVPLQLYSHSAWRIQIELCEEIELSEKA